jgi:hypothetical protein
MYIASIFRVEVLAFTLHTTRFHLKYYKYLGSPFLRNTVKLTYQNTDIMSVVSKVWGANRLGVED